MTTGFEYLLSGQLFNSFFAAFATIGIAPEFVYLLLTVVMCGFIYIRTRSPTFVSLVLVITGAVLSQYVAPDMGKYFYGMVLIGIVLGVYSAFKEW